MKQNIPPRNLNPGHVRALIDIVESDAFVIDVTGTDDEDTDLAGLVVLIAARRWVCDHGSLLQHAATGEAVVAAITAIARDASDLLSIDDVRRSLTGDILRAIQRVSILTLDNLGLFKPKTDFDEEPF